MQVEHTPPQLLDLNIILKARRPEVFESAAAVEYGGAGPLQLALAACPLQGQQAVAGEVTRGQADLFRQNDRLAGAAFRQPFQLADLRTQVADAARRFVATQKVAQLIEVLRELGIGRLQLAQVA